MEKWAELSPAGTAIHILQKHGRGQVYKEKCGGPLSANGLMCAIGRGCFTPTSTSGLTSGVCVAADVLTDTIHDRGARSTLARAFGSTAFPSRRCPECLCGITCYRDCLLLQLHGLLLHGLLLHYLLLHGLLLHGLLLPRLLLHGLLLHELLPGVLLPSWS